MTSYSVLSDDDATFPERITADFTHGAARMLLDLATITDEEGNRDEDSEAFAEAWHSPAYGWEMDAFDPESRAKIEARCAAFVEANFADVCAAAEEPYNVRWHGAYSVGQDYVLTSEHHGAGFWDRGMGDLGDRLTTAAHADGAFNAWHTAEATTGEAHVEEV